MALACVIECIAVFHDAFYGMGRSVTARTVIRHGLIQLSLVTEENLVIPEAQFGQVNSVLPGKC